MSRSPGMAERQQDTLSAADTPPTSPLDSSHLHTTKPTSLPNRLIHIDDNGVHDFDFRKRQENPEPRKLRKLIRRSSPNQRSVFSMADIPARSRSLDSDTSSIRKRFSALFPSNKDTLHKSNSGKSSISATEQEDDPLPDTKKELEARLNHHLVELDMLRKTLQAANDMVNQHKERYEILQGRQTNDMQVFMKRQRQMVNQARDNRDAYRDFVSFHRRQIERIRHKRIEIEKDAGLEPTLPQVYKSMWKDEDWARLFQV